MKLYAFLVTRDLGGQAVDSSKILNYMGYDFITGPELVDKFKDQLLRSHYIDHLISEVGHIIPGEEGFTVVTSVLIRYTAKSLIVANEMTRRRLVVPGEEDFQRKGVFFGNIQDPSFVVGTDCSTSRPGIFAAGDVTNVFGERIIIASGEKAKAALAAGQFIAKA